MRRVKKNRPVSTSTNVTSVRTDVMKMRFVSMSLEVTNADVRPAITAMDSFARVSDFFLIVVVSVYQLFPFLNWDAEETVCSRVRCTAYSQCVENDKGHAECRCIDGYEEISNQCLPIGSSLPNDCRHEEKCSIHAQCTYSSQEDQYICRCFNGYQGDGFNCTQISGNQIRFNS